MEKKPKPESFARVVVEKYQVVAHYKDRIDESSFSGTLFERKCYFPLKKHQHFRNNRSQEKPPFAVHP